jgi:subtilisin family serine protease
MVILVIAVLVVSGALAANNANKEVKIFKPSKSLITGNDAGNVIADKGVYKRVIADDINENDIKLFKNNGCSIKHSLKHSVSFDCPEDVISNLNVREARIFHIIDLEADQQIKADQVWAEGINGTGVNVVILDTGIDISHIELSGSIKGQKDIVDNDDIAEDDNGHGTHVAGIITANGVHQIDGNYATGVSPGAGIYMLRVCGSDGYCYEDDMMAAMEYAVYNLDAKVMSISIGGGNFGSHCDSDPLAAKVNWVVDNGYTVVVAAGNDGKGVSSPACASKAIAVGAVDKSGVVPYWSNRGTALDIVAPGVDILSTYSCLAAGNCGTYWYAHMSGTSMSTPHVSGVIALLLGTNPGLTTSEIKAALYDTASPVNKCYKCTRWAGTRCLRQAVVTCTLDVTGTGVVNAYGAYLAVKPEVPNCSVNEECNDGLYCNGVETCVAGVCQPGTQVGCSNLGDQCNDGVCDEAADSCAAQPKPDGTSCDDGLYCNVGETCQIGVCTGGQVRACDDGKSCTTDSCNEEMDTCENVWPGCGIADGCCGPACSSINDTDCAVKCWSAEYQYLYNNKNQAKKFCKCAQGTYGYNSYSYNSGSKTVYRYLDSGNNENWGTTSALSYSPVWSVKCTDGKWYNTSQDYLL